MGFRSKRMSDEDNPLFGKNYANMTLHNHLGTQQSYNEQRIQLTHSNLRHNCHFVISCKSLSNKFQIFSQDDITGHVGSVR